MVCLPILFVLMALTPTGVFALETSVANSGAESEPPVDTRPVVAENDFLPTDRSISECISVLPKPGCGSEARGGWGQTSVFLALIGGLGVIVTRIVIGVRRRDAELMQQRSAGSAGPREG